MKNSLFTFKSLFGKLLYSYTFLTIIPIIALGLLAFIFSEQIINKKIIKSEINTTVEISKNIEVMVDQVVAIVNMYNLNSNLKDQLQQKSKDDYAKIKQMTLIENEMSSYSSAFDWLRHNSILLGVNGSVYSSNHMLSRVNMNNLANYEWSNALLHEPDRITWLKTQKSFLNDQKDVYVFIAAKTLKYEFSNELCGILFFMVDESSLYNIYQECLNENNEIFISDCQGNIISHSLRKKVGTTIDLSKYLGDTADQSQGYHTILVGHHKFFCIFKKIEKTGWYVVETIPMVNIFKDINALKAAIFAACLFCLAFSIFMSVIVSRKITIPLLSLTRKVKGYRLNHACTDPKNTTDDELTILNVEYDHLLNELNDTINKLMKEQNEKRKAELQALQMQIAPHFLYNTINSIKCLIWTGKIRLIEPMLDALVNLLENTINRSDELITIKQEFDLIKNYIYIHEIRAGNTITVNFEIEPNLLQSKIPKLLLQPIVENAIFHGLEPKGSNGSISISCYADSGDLKIEILDNGIGISLEQIEKLLSPDDPQEQPKKHFSGIGLKNVEERLKLYFGPKYGLKIYSSKGIGTSIIVTLPKLP